MTELKEWLEEHPDFGLDMERLEEREVLITPPHWSYVSTAPAAPSGAGANTGANIGMSLEEHRQAVQKYARMLGDRQLPLEEALALAAFAGVASTSNDPAEKLRDALKALPKGAKMHPATMLESIPDSLSRLVERTPPASAEARQGPRMGRGRPASPRGDRELDAGAGVGPSGGRELGKHGASVFNCIAADAETSIST